MSEAMESGTWTQGKQLPHAIVGPNNWYADATNPEAASHIVKCCNGYPKALYMLAELVGAIDGNCVPASMIEQARAVLSDLQEDSSTASKAEG